MITTIVLWICIVFSFLCGISCFIGTFTKKTVNERVIYFTSFLYHGALLYFLISSI